MNQLDLRS